MTYQSEAFKKGRLETFSKIRLLLKYDPERLGVSGQRDIFPFGLTRPQIFAIQRLYSHTAEMVQDLYGRALTQLEAGDTIYQLTGQDTIRSYKPITDGDFNAGALSAVEDFQMLLFTFNGDFLVSQALDQVNIASSPLYPLDRSLIKMGVHLTQAVYRDIVTIRLHEDIAMKLSEPIELEYENRHVFEPAKPPIKVLFSAIARIEHPLSRCARRQDKIKRTWPQMSATGSFAMAQMATPTPVNAQAVPPRQPQPLNNNAEFIKGYSAGLSSIYMGLQDIHYDSIHKNRDYAAQIGMAAGWENAIHSVASNIFPALRNDVRAALQANARGIGEDASAGIKAAVEFVQNTILDTRLPPQDAQDMAQQQVLASLKKFWIKTAMALSADAAASLPSPVITPSP